MGGFIRMIEDRYYIPKMLYNQVNGKKAWENYKDLVEQRQYEADLDRQTDEVAADIAAKVDSALESLRILD